MVRRDDLPGNAVGVAEDPRGTDRAVLRHGERKSWNCPFLHEGHDKAVRGVSAEIGFRGGLPNRCVAGRGAVSETTQVDQAQARPHVRVEIILIGAVL